MIWVERRQREFFSFVPGFVLFHDHLLEVVHFHSQVVQFVFQLRVLRLEDARLGGSHHVHHAAILATLSRSQVVALAPLDVLRVRGASVDRPRRRRLRERRAQTRVGVAELLGAVGLVRRLDDDGGHVQRLRRVVNRGVRTLTPVRR